jgi:hypothetical protein
LKKQSKLLTWPMKWIRLLKMSVETAYGA